MWILYLVFYNFTEEELKEGYKRCIENVQNLLDSAKLLLSNENSHQYALGLYMYAIEEYGKAQILMGYVNSTKYSIPGWIFGKDRPPSKRNSHDEKLLEGFKKLPTTCTKLSGAIEITYNSCDVYQTFVIKKDDVPIGPVSIPPFTTGIFEDSINPILKTACFYVDWDNSKRSWESIIPVDKDQLMYNITLMKEIVSKPSLI